MKRYTALGLLACIVGMWWWVSTLSPRSQPKHSGASEDLVSAAGVVNGGPVSPSPHHGWKQTVTASSSAPHTNKTIRSTVRSETTGHRDVSRKRLGKAKVAHPVLPAPPRQPSRIGRWPDATWEHVNTEKAARGEMRQYRIHAPHERYSELIAVENWQPDATGKLRFFQETVMVADHILVQARIGIDREQMQDLATRHGCEIREAMFAPGHFLIAFAEPGLPTLEKAVADFQAEAAQISVAEPDYILFASLTPNDPAFGSMWGPHNTGQSGGVPDVDYDGPEAWDLFTGSDNVVVGVIDSGTQLNHPDLVDNLWVNPLEVADNGIDDDGNGLIDDVHGYDFYAFDSDPADEHGHGTHVAGTVGAVGNNGIGVVGVSWRARLMTLRFLGPSGSGPTSAAINCIYYARSQLLAGEPVRLTNNSWGGSGNSSSLLNAINAAGNSGQLFVVAAGNDNLNIDVNPVYPAAFSTVHSLCVANLTRTGARNGTSNYGATRVDIGAPGTTILSTYPGSQYAYLSGTSMASPQVAGAAAILFSLAPNASVADVKAWIMDSGHPQPSMNGITVTGDRLDLFNAIEEAGMRVADSDPDVDEIVSSPPTTFVIDLTGVVDGSTVQPGDLLVNGINASSATVTGPRQITFTFGSSPVTSQGLQNMSIAAGAFQRTDGLAVAAWNANFRWDAVLLQVATTTPADGSVVPLGFATIDLHWNESIDAASIDAADLLLSRGQVTGASWISSFVSRYTLSGVDQEGPLALWVMPGAVNDSFGNGCTAWNGSLLVDRTIAANEGNFEPLPPIGGMVYRRQTTGFVHNSSDVDAFQVPLNAGQNYSALVEATPGVAWTLQLWGVGLEAEVIGAVGQTAMLPATPTLFNGTKELRISGSTTSPYRINEVLNAQTATNGTPVQSLAGSEVIAVPPARMPRRAVYGHLHGGDPEHRFDLGDMGDVAIARIGGTVNAEWIDTATSSSLGNASLAISEVRFSPEDYGGTNAPDIELRLTGDGEYVVVHTPLDAFNDIRNELPASAQAIRTNVLGGFPGQIPMLTAEIEPNDDGVIGGSVRDVDAANDLRGDFILLSGNQYRAIVTGEVDPAWDEDWDFFRFHAEPGDSVMLELWGQQSGRGSLEDPTVRLYDAYGNELAVNDDIQNGIQRESRLIYSSFSYTGNYYAVADSWDYTLGSYELWVTLTVAGGNELWRPATADRYTVDLLPFERLGVDVHMPRLLPGTVIPNDVLIQFHDTNGNYLGDESYEHFTTQAETIQITALPYNYQFGDYVLLLDHQKALATWLVVEAEHGHPDPPVGSNVVQLGSTTASIPSPVTAGGTQFVATSWSGSGDVPASGSGTSVVFDLQTPSSIRWEFVTNVAVNVSIAGSGSVNGVSGWVRQGTSMTLQAVAAPHFDFVGWSGDAGGSNPTLNLTANTPLSLTATFAKRNYNLTVTSAEGTPDPEVGLHSLPALSTVAASVNPPIDPAGIRHPFLGWSGTGDVPTSGVATSVPPFQITQPSSLTWLWSTQGLVTASAGVGGAVDATGGWLDWGTTLTVNAAPDPHFDFNGWSGDTDGATINDVQITLPVDGPRAVTANFVRKQYELTVVSDPDAVSPAVGTTLYDSESELTLQAVSNRVEAGGSEFLLIGWSGTGSVPGSGGTSRVDIVLNEPSAITWHWQTNHFLDVAIEAGGSVDVGSSFVAADSIVSLTATADLHFDFAGWIGDLGGVNAFNNPLTLTMDQPRNVTAQFTRKLYNLGVASVFGSSSPAVGNYNLPSESTQTVSLTVSAVTNGLTRHHALGWSGSGALGNGNGHSTGPFSLTAPTTVTWIWNTNHFLDVSTTGGGSVNVGDGWHADGDVVNLTATPQAHHEFTGWSGDLNGATINGNQLTVPMDQGRQITASFARLDYDLDVISAHGISSPAVGTHSLPSESVQTVALTVSAVTNGLTRHHALGWSGSGALGNGNGHSTGPFSLTAPTTVTWIWNTNHFLDVSTTGGGSVNVGDSWHMHGAVVNLTATPQAHHEFTGWSGDLNGATINDNQLTVPMDQGRQITASFARLDYDLDVISAHGISSPAVGTHSLPSDSVQTVALTVSAVTNGLTRHHALGWSGSGALGNGNGHSTGPFSLTAPTTVTWIWNTNHFLDVSTTGGGSVNVGDGWHADGDVVNLTATPQAHHEFTGWSGDLNGATINGNQLTVPMDQGRQITASFARLDYDLDVISMHGTSSPAVGTHSLPSESVQTVALTVSAVTNGLTRHHALGVERQWRAWQWQRAQHRSLQFDRAYHSDLDLEYQSLSRCKHHRRRICQCGRQLAHARSRGKSDRDTTGSS